MNTTAKTILQWIALPFAVVAIYLLIPIASYVLFYIQSVLFKTDMDSFSIILYIIAPGAAAYFAVVVAWHMAPTHKSIAAITVYALLVFFMGGAFIGEAATASLWKLIGIVVQVVVGGYALWSVIKDTKPKITLGR